MSSDKHGHIACHLADVGKLAWASLENEYFHWHWSCCCSRLSLVPVSWDSCLDHRYLGYACNCGSLEENTFPQPVVSPHVREV